MNSARQRRKPGNQAPNAFPGDRYGQTAEATLTIDVSSSSDCS